MSLRRNAAVFAMALLSCLPLSGVVGQTILAASVWTFPGQCNVNILGTLKECVDHAFDGDRIDIATNVPIDELLEVTDKSLAIRAKPGFHPRIKIGMSVRASGAHGAIDVSVRDISFDELVEADFTGGSGHKLSIRGGRITSPVLPYALFLRSGVASTFDIQDVAVRVNGLYVAGDFAGGVVLDASQPSGRVHLRLVGNRIDGRGTATSGSGVQLALSGSGETRADVYSNAVQGFGACECLSAAGLSIDTKETPTADVNIVGNTFHSSHVNGIFIRNQLASGGSLAVDLFDDIVSDTGASALFFLSTDPATLAVRAGHNDLVNNGASNRLEGHSLGSGNRHVSPRYVDGPRGDLRLRSNSPLIDRGIVCSPGGVSIIDAATHHRLRGPTVDMGAYESGGGPPGGAARVGSSGHDVLGGTSGPDILCGMGGPDRLTGKAGADYLDGGTGGDTLCAKDGTHGNDRVIGGSGSDGYRADSGDHRSSVEHLGSCP